MIPGGDPLGNGTGGPGTSSQTSSTRTWRSPGPTSWPWPKADRAPTAPSSSSPSGRPPGSPARTPSSARLPTRPAGASSTPSPRRRPTPATTPGPGRGHREGRHRDPLTGEEPRLALPRRVDRVRGLEIVPTWSRLPGSASRASARVSASAPQWWARNAAVPSLRSRAGVPVDERVGRGQAVPIRSWRASSASPRRAVAALVAGRGRHASPGRSGPRPRL